MRFKTCTLIATLTITLAGCVAPQQRTPVAPVATAPAKAPHAFKAIDFKYDPKSPEAVNFSRQLDLPAWQCDLEATTGNTMVRYASAQTIAVYNNSLSECFKHARAQGDEAVNRLKAAKVPARQAELSKDLYAKWSVYMGTMSAYRTTDQQAKSAYQAAKEALATEVKFSN
jgi:nitrous oxide reductase accessory protein NosL